MSSSSFLAECIYRFIVGSDVSRAISKCTCSCLRIVVTISQQGVLTPFEDRWERSAAFRQLFPPAGEEITRVIEAARRQRAVDMDLKLLFELIVYGGMSRRLGINGF